MIFGDKVRHVLKQKNISQSKLAELLGITRQSVTSLLKQKKPHQKTIENVADVLNLKPNYFDEENEDQSMLDEFLILKNFRYPKSTQNDVDAIPTFDYNVRTVLRSRGITIGKLAQILGTTSEKLITILRQDNPSYQIIKTVSDALDIKVDELMSYATTIEDEFIEDFNEKGLELISFDEDSLIRRKQTSSDRFLTFLEVMDYDFEKVLDAGEKLYGKLKNSIKKSTELNDGEIERILSLFPDINPKWIKSGSGPMTNQFVDEKIEILKHEGHNFVIDGEFLGMGVSHSQIVISPLIDKWYMRTYKAQLGDNYSLKEYPRHAIILESNVIASHNYGPYRSFEVVDGEIPNNPKESILNGSIVTGRRINHFDPNFKNNIRKCDDLVLVTNKGISINRAVTNALKESLTLKPTINSDGSEQYGQFNMKHILEVWHVIAITQYPK